MTHRILVNLNESVILEWRTMHQFQNQNHEHHKLPGHEMDFANVEILDRANTVKKLELKEILYIRKLKPSLNKQLESELFTLIIRNVNSSTQ